MSLEQSQDARDTDPIAVLQLDDFGTQLVRELKAFFDDRAYNFRTSKVETSPYLEVLIDFCAYNYIVVTIHVERGTAFFAIKQQSLAIRLTSVPLKRFEAGPGDILGVEALKLLDAEIRLRIPDKYLIAKGWGAST